MERFEVLDVFLDGERVDAGELEHALSTGEGRRYLTDVLKLREGVMQGMPVLDAARPHPPAVGPRLAMAAAIVLSLAGGYAAGQWRGMPASRPEPAVASFEEPAPAPIIPAPPPPTSIIRLEPGDGWSESTGG